MKVDFELLKTLRLFQGFDSEELEHLLDCFGYRIEHYKKNDVIFGPGDTLKSCRMILSGIVQISQTDIMGNRSIMFKADKGQVFGEMVSCMPQPCVLLATAETDCTVLALDMQKIISPCSFNCKIHSRLMVNLLLALAEKGEIFYIKARTLAQKTARERITDFLNQQAKKAGQRHFKIAFSREELADYLCMNRSSLSRELCRMREAGLIQFRRNFFELLYEPPSESE